MRPAVTFRRLLLAVLGLIALLSAASICRAQSVDRRVAYPFLVRADFPLAEYSALFDELIQMQNEVTRVLALPPPREAVHIVLFRDEATYRAYGKKHFPAVPFRRALFVKAAGPGTVYAFRGPELPVDVRHESTHGLLHARHVANGAPVARRRPGRIFRSRRRTASLGQSAPRRAQVEFETGPGAASVATGKST